MKQIAKLMLPIVLVLVFDSCSQPKPNSPDVAPKAGLAQNLPVTQTDKTNCLKAARKLLGSSAEILKCGHLSDDDNLEAVAAIRVPGLKDDGHGTPISKLMILRQGKARWDTELNIDKEITNGEGYIGIDFIDDSDPFPYYRVHFSDRGATWGARDPSQFTLVLIPMTRDGKLDVGGIGIGIGWNPAVRRFQEIEPSGEEFAPEVKAPGHIRSAK
jgi:hypothetical protein